MDTNTKSDIKTKRIPVKNLQGHTLVGDYGGLSQITGNVYPSNVIKGCYAIETEHGTLYLDEEFDVTVLE